MIACYPEVGKISSQLLSAPIDVVEFNFAAATARQLIQFVRQNSVRGVYLTDVRYLSWRYALLRIRRRLLDDHS